MGNRKRGRSPLALSRAFSAFLVTYLFVQPNAETADVLGPLNGVNNRLREFVRSLVSGPKVDPNHGCRHLFITRCRAAGVDAELRRMITGHAGQSVDERASTATPLACTERFASCRGSSSHEKQRLAYGRPIWF